MATTLKPRHIVLAVCALAVLIPNDGWRALFGEAWRMAIWVPLGLGLLLLSYEVFLAGRARGWFGSGK